MGARPATERMQMTTTEVTLDAAATKAFLQGLRGRVLQPGDEGYDDARKL